MTSRALVYTPRYNSEPAISTRSFRVAGVGAEETVGTEEKRRRMNRGDVCIGGNRERKREREREKFVQ